MKRSSASWDRWLRGAATAAVAAGGLGVHLVVQRLAPAPLFSPGESLVGLVPFLPWTVWIYLLFFPFLVATGVLVPAERHRRLVLAWALASVTAWALVLLVPTTFPRPDPAAAGDPVHRFVLERMWGLDSAHVTFPCLHSAITWISWLALADRGPRLRAVLFVLAVGITLSTMTTRQHLVTDNVAGLLIAGFCGALVWPQRRRAVGARLASPAE